jgi:NAD(P)H-flavin reductase
MTVETAELKKTANPYAPLEAAVEEVIIETPKIKTLVLRPERPLPFLSGQFIQLTMPGLGEAPFTPSSSPEEPERLEITIILMGLVTEALHRLKPGDHVGIRGPFGKGYPLDKLEGKEVLVIGGGCGLAPLRALLYSLFRNVDKYKKVVIKYGAKCPDELLYRRMYEEWSRIPGVDFAVTVDVGAPGWTGHVGVVTTLLDDLDMDRENTLVLSCGPAIMFRFVTQKLLEIGYKPHQIYLSMNRRMSCGTGKCGKCIIGPYYVCKDGPDMNFEKIKDYPNLFA